MSIGYIVEVSLGDPGPKNPTSLTWRSENQTANQILIFVLKSSKSSRDFPLLHYS